METHRIPILVALVGVPGSGKSTTAGRLKEMHEFDLISTDALREELLGDENDQSQQHLVFFEAHKRLERNMRYGIDTIFDATSCRKEHRLRIIDSSSVAPCMKVVMEQECSLDEALDRNFLRNRKVPEKVISNMYKNLQKEPVDYDEGWSYIVGLDDYDHIESFFDIREYEERKLAHD